MHRHTARVAGAAIAALALVGPAFAQVAPKQPDAHASTLPPASGSRWVVDPVHSQVEFGIRHLVGRVRGSFARWYGVISTPNEDWTDGKVSVQVQTASINTGNSYRDADLRSPRFLASDSFPTMNFDGRAIMETDSTLRIGGTLTLRGHVRHVVLRGRFEGIGKDREGKERIAFTASTVVDRRDYGISYNEVVEGTKLIGDDVEITISLEAVKAS